MPPALRPVDYRIDPFDLRLFTTVLATGTITAAASALGLSLAAASTRLKALEGQIGARLLDRSKAGAAPTVAGQALARRAHQVLAELETLHAEMSRFAGGMRGSLRVMCNTSAMAEVLPRALGRFLRAHPDLDIELQEQPSDATLEALRQGAADVGIVASHVDTSGLVAHAWLEDPLVAVVSAEADAGAVAASLDGVAQTSLSDLLRLPFIGLPADSGLSRFLAQQARQSGQLPHHRVRVAGIDAVAQLVASGVGVAVLPLHAVQRWRGGSLRTIPLSDVWAQRHLVICATPEAIARPPVPALVDGLLAGASDSGATRA